MKKLLPLLCAVLCCAFSVVAQISFPKGSMSGPVLVANLPAIGNSNLLYDVRDAASAGTCATGGGSVRVICHWTGSAYAVVAGADVSGNVIANNFVPGFATTATAAGTTTLTVASKGIQAFTGVTTQTVVLPVVTTLPQTGFGFVIQNDSSGAVTVNSSGGNTVQVMAAGTRATFTCKLLTGTSAASWNVTYLPATFGITNTAPSGNVPVSDGTNLVSGSLSDNAAGSLSTGAGVPLSFTSDTSIGATAPVQTNTAATSISEVTPLWQVGGSTGQAVFTDSGFVSNFGLGTDAAHLTLTIDPTTGYITKYANSTATDGQVLIGNSSSGKLEKSTLSQGSGISITNGSGSITIAQDNTGLGAILAILVNNTVLAQATGTVYASPGNDGTALSIATEGNVSFPITRAGTIRNLYVRTGGTAKVNTPATTITIRKNGVDTAVTLAMTQTVNTTTSDTTHSFTVVAGDLITVSFVTTGAAAVSTSIAGVSFELD